MARQQYDRLDYKILGMLSGNARKPFLEIARETNVSGAAIHQRIQKLTSNGAIQGFESIINPSTAGYETCAYIGFILNDPTSFQEVVDRLSAIPEIVECHYTTGQYDLLAKIFARNNGHLLDIIHDKLQGLGRTETLISFKEVFRRPMPITSSNFE
jgi:Transcriptional regulators